MDGIIGSFYNVIPDLYLKIWAAVKASDIPAAAQLQSKAVHVIMAGLRSGSMMACIKAWLRGGGIPAGYARRPFTNFSPEQERELLDQLAAIDRADGLGLDIVKRIRAR